jgi:hypothetical protein
METPLWLDFLAGWVAAQVLAGHIETTNLSSLFIAFVNPAAGFDRLRLNQQYQFSL